MDLAFLLEKAVPTLLTSAGSAVGAVWRFTHKLNTRVAELERNLSALQLALANAEVQASQHKKELLEQLADLRRVFTVVRTDFDSEIDEIYGTLKTRAKEQADIRRLLNKLTERYIGLEARLEQAEAALNKINDSLKEFMQEQREQWQTTAKTLGQIEGYLRGISRRIPGSGSFPPIK